LSTATLILLFFLLAGCAASPFTWIRTPSRIGLLAPFEGLYRQNGYNALAAMRGVVENDPGLKLPVALDTSRGAERAARKLLASRNSSAVVGPLTPAEAADARRALLGIDIRWLLPFAQIAGEPVAVDSPAWLVSLIEEVSSGPAADFGVSRLAIAGYAPVFTMINKADLESLLAEQVELPIVWVETPTDVEENDLLLWLGDAAEGVRFVAQVREASPQTPVWLPVWAAGDVFVAHANALPTWRWQEIMWGGWLPPAESNTETLTPSAAESALVAAATRQAIAYLYLAPGEWRFVTLPLQPE